MAAILLVLLYRLIFVFSGQDGEESGSLSAMISEKCAELLNAISGKHWTQNVLDSMAAYFEHPIRKLAHFSEYACMGVLLYGVWRPWKERGRKLYLLIVCWVFVSAGADEFHQLFIPGRYGCFADEPGEIAAVATILALKNISIKNIGIVHNREYEGGVLRIEFYQEEAIEKSTKILREKGYSLHNKN